MTTSDDERGYADEPAIEETTHVEATGLDAATVDAEPGARWPLAILAALAAAAVGVVAWAYIYTTAEREYVGVSVVIGLTVGWLIRVISRRSTLPARILAVVITALACVAGTVTGEVAYTAKTFQADFWRLLGDVLPDTFTLLRDRPGLTYVIFAAALVLAFLSAGPQKEKPKKRDETPAPAESVDEPPRDPLAE